MDYLSSGGTGQPPSSSMEVESDPGDRLHQICKSKPYRGKRKDINKKLSSAVGESARNQAQRLGEKQRRKKKKRTEKNKGGEQAPTASQNSSRGDEDEEAHLEKQKKQKKKKQKKQKKQQEQKKKQSSRGGRVEEEDERSAGSGSEEGQVSAGTPDVLGEVIHLSGSQDRDAEGGLSSERGSQSLGEGGDIWLEASQSSGGTTVRAWGHEREPDRERKKAITKKVHLADTGMVGYIAIDQNFEAKGTMLQWAEACADTLSKAKKAPQGVSPFHDPSNLRKNMHRRGPGGNLKKSPGLLVFFSSGGGPRANHHSGV